MMNKIMGVCACCLLLVSCINFSGKLDSVGRRDAVFDPAKAVTTRCRIGEKTYVPVTVRYCDASERIYDDVVFCRLGAYRIGEPEPQGREVTLWTEYKGTKKDEEEQYYVQCEPLLTADKLDRTHAVITQGKPLRQEQLLCRDKDIDIASYWMAEPWSAELDHHPKSLDFAVDVAPERTLGNYLRRPLVYALKLVDIPLSFISVNSYLLRHAIDD